MKVLGIETSCDECSIAVVNDGRTIDALATARQTDVHRPYRGVVPELGIAQSYREYPANVSAGIATGSLYPRYS